jgi:O-antigen/teichoic acid export membrane protein
LHPLCAFVEPMPGKVRSAEQTEMNTQDRSGEGSAFPVEGQGPLAANVATGTAWLSVARLCVNLLGFAGLILLARLLTPEDFGVVAIAATLFAIVSAATNLPIAHALIQHAKPDESLFHTAFTLSLLRGCLVFAAIVLLSIPAVVIFTEPRLARLLPALALGAVLVGAQNPRLAVFARQMEFKQQFLLQVSEKLIALIFSATCAFLFQSPWALVLGILAGQSCALILGYVMIPYRPRFALSGFRELMSFSIWLSLGQVINTINWRLDQLLIGRQLGPEALGHYTVGDNLAALPTREITAPLHATLFPAFARLADMPERLRAAFTRAQSMIVAIALPVGVGAALLADPLVRLALGEKWLPSVVVIQGLAAIFALQTIGALAEPLAMATGRTKLMFMRDMQGFVIRVPLVIIGLLAGGVPGVVAARIVSGSVGIAFNMAIIRRVTGISIGQQLRGPMRSLISAAAMAIIVLILGFFSAVPHGPFGLLADIALKAACGAATYVGVHLLLWRMMGLPSGPESELIMTARRVSSRLRAVAGEAREMQS